MVEEAEEELATGGALVFISPQDTFGRLVWPRPLVTKSKLEKTLKRPRCENKSFYHAQFRQEKEKKRKEEKTLPDCPSEQRTPPPDHTPSIPPPTQLGLADSASTTSSAAATATAAAGPTPPTRQETWKIPKKNQCHL